VTAPELLTLRLKLAKELATTITSTKTIGRRERRTPFAYLEKIFVAHKTSTLGGKGCATWHLSESWPVIIKIAPYLAQSFFKAVATSTRKKERVSPNLKGSSGG